jgi:hypothetical protein
MAKGARDIILRDRLEFTTTATGNTSLVYGRVDLSDYVSIVKNEGLAIKEVRFQFRVPSDDNGWPIWMNTEDLATVPAGNVAEANICAFATTTAYENAADVGIASPNVLCMFEKKSTIFPQGWADYADHAFGTPDLHPEGYDVVTDLLIGVYANNLQNSRLVDTTLELDIMIIAEPKKITQKDLTQMLTQAQDL